MRRIFPLLFPLAFTAAAAGGIAAPSSRAVVSPDGRRVLVMLSEDPEYDRMHPQLVTLPDGRVINIREGFARSGAYDAGTLAPLWQVDWSSWSLLSSDDFRSIVRLNWRGFDSGIDSDWALAFYDEGRLVRRYDFADLLTRLRHDAFLQFTSSGWHTVWYGDFELKGGRVNLSTARRRLRLAEFELDLRLQEFYTFDLATGSMLSRRTEGAWFVWLGGVLAAAPVVVPAALFVVWRKRRVARGRRARGENPLRQ